MTTGLIISFILGFLTGWVFVILLLPKGGVPKRKSLPGDDPPR